MHHRVRAPLPSRRCWRPRLAASFRPSRPSYPCNALLLGCRLLSRVSLVAHPISLRYPVMKQHWCRRHVSSQHHKAPQSTAQRTLAAATILSI
jgi:hypothetical protein